MTICRPVIVIDNSAGVFFIKRRQQANGCALENMLTLKHELRKACFIAVGANQQRNIKLLAAGKDLQRMIRNQIPIDGGAIGRIKCNRLALAPLLDLPARTKATIAASSSPPTGL